jgi:hypothetical protein
VFPRSSERKIILSTYPGCITSPLVVGLWLPLFACRTLPRITRLRLGSLSLPPMSSCMSQNSRLIVPDTAQRFLFFNGSWHHFNTGCRCELCEKLQMCLYSFAVCCLFRIRCRNSSGDTEAPNQSTGGDVRGGFLTIGMVVSEQDTSTLGQSMAGLNGTIRRGAQQILHAANPLSRLATQVHVKMCLHTRTARRHDGCRVAAVLRNSLCGHLLIHKNACRQTSLNKRQRSSMNRPRLACRSTTVHTHVKAAVMVKVAWAWVMVIASFPADPPCEAGKPIIEVWKIMHAAVTLRLGSS